MSQQLSLAILAISMLVITFFTVLISVVTVVVLLRLRSSISTLTNRVQPLISQATETVKAANGVADSVKLHADHIMGKAEDAVEDVSRKVKATTNIVHESISPPMVTVASLVTGVSRGLEVWGQVHKRGGNGNARR